MSSTAHTCNSFFHPFFFSLPPDVEKISRRPKSPWARRVCWILCLYLILDDHSKSIWQEFLHQRICKLPNVPFQKGTMCDLPLQFNSDPKIEIVSHTCMCPDSDSTLNVFDRNLRWKPNLILIKSSVDPVTKKHKGWLFVTWSKGDDDLKIQIS